MTLILVKGDEIISDDKSQETFLEHNFVATDSKVFQIGNGAVIGSFCGHLDADARPLKELMLSVHALDYFLETFSDKIPGKCIPSYLSAFCRTVTIFPPEVASTTLFVVARNFNLAAVKRTATGPMACEPVGKESVVGGGSGFVPVMTLLKLGMSIKEALKVVPGIDNCMGGDVYSTNLGRSGKLKFQGLVCLDAITYHMLAELVNDKVLFGDYKTALILNYLAFLVAIQDGTPDGLGEICRVRKDRHRIPLHMRNVVRILESKHVVEALLERDDACDFKVIFALTNKALEGTKYKLKLLPGSFVRDVVTDYCFSEEE